jgi:hypothetical protein
MARSPKEIEQELLNLPEAERARLAHRLIVSLDADLPRDEVQPIPAEEAMRRAREALNRKK